MAKISLKHLLKKETASIIKQLITGLGGGISIEDANGKILLGTTPQNGPSFLIESGNIIFGQIKGAASVAKPIADLILHLVNQEIEKKTLALQSAAAIQNALLFEKGIKEVQQREESIRRIHEASTRFVPNQFVRSLGYENITEVTLGDNVEKEVTVFFNDIRGYTTLAETMTPSENFKFVNAFYGRMGPFVQQYEGFINQYLGDAIMALFTQNPSDALKAAIGMQLALQTYNEERCRKNRSPIRMGVGIHTGPLIMGIIGDQNRLDAATIADSVNTSSRIESLTKHFGVSILLSEESLKKLDNPAQFNTRYLGKVQVKGKNEPIGVYECFDGDALELQALKSKTLADFEKGIDAYYQRNFLEAANVFNTVLKTNPHDQPSRLFLYKAIDFNNEGVEDDWNGVEIITFK